jgi:hypothetical protein
MTASEERRIVIRGSEAGNSLSISGKWPLYQEFNPGICSIWMLGCAVMSLPEDIFVDSEGMNASISLASTVFKKAAMKWDGRPKEMYT